jgi:hypothetical protein
MPLLWNFDEAEGESQIQKVARLAVEGLFVDGGHHKQWYLEQILQTLMGERKFEKLVLAWEKAGLDLERGKAP